MFRRVCLALCCVCLLTGSCLAQSWWFSFGPKIGYRWGSGWEGGVELTWFPPDQRPRKIPQFGATLDYMPWSHTPSIRLGGEISYQLLGADLGVMWMKQNGMYSSHLSSIVFIGGILYPYYQLDLRFADFSVQHSVGAYLKAVVAGTAEFISKS